jgi:hypothetical protein
MNCHSAVLTGIEGCESDLPVCKDVCEDFYEALFACTAQGDVSILVEQECKDYPTSGCFLNQ